MSNDNPWIAFKDQLPPPRETIEVWDDYDEQVLTGELFHYDGKYVRIKMRHWYIEQPMYDFSHWRIPEPELEQPKVLSQETNKEGV